MPLTEISLFGAGSGFGGSPRPCTRRQNGVNTRSPRFSLLRIACWARQEVAAENFRGRHRHSASAASTSAATA